MDKLDEKILQIVNKLDEFSEYLNLFLEEMKNWKMLIDIDLDEITRLKHNKTRKINEIKNELSTDPDEVNLDGIKKVFTEILELKNSFMAEYGSVPPDFIPCEFRKHFDPLEETIKDFNEYIKNKTGYIIIENSNNRFEIECKKSDFNNILHDKDKILPFFNNDEQLTEHYVIKDELGRLVLNTLEFCYKDDIAYKRSYEVYFTYNKEQIKEKNTPDIER